MKQNEEMAEIIGALRFHNTSDYIAERLYNAGYRKQSNVAREIFEEMENVINNELQNNCKVLPQFEFSNELWNKVSGRIEALKEICDFIAELKNKYTEVQK